MYIIVMDNNKQLIPTFGQNIFYSENLVDKIKFLLPKLSDNLDISELIVEIQYIKNGIVIHFEELKMDNISLIDDKISYYSLATDTVFAKRRDVVEFRLRLSTTNTDGENQTILETLPCRVNILPAKIFHDNNCPYHNPCDDDIDSIKGLQLQIDVIGKILMGKADNIIFNQEENEIQLTSSDAKIGEPISLDYLKDSIVTDSVTDAISEIIATDEEIKSFLNTE